MLRLLAWLRGECRINGSVVTTGGGEIAFEFNDQLLAHAHRDMLRAGFIVHDGLYIYRPRKRSGSGPVL